MSKTNISRYLTDLYGAVNVLWLKIKFAAQRKLRLPAFEIGFVSASLEATPRQVGFVLPGSKNAFFVSGEMAFLRVAQINMVEKLDF